MHAVLKIYPSCLNTIFSSSNCFFFSVYTVTLPSFNLLLINFFFFCTLNYFISFFSLRKSAEFKIGYNVSNNGFLLKKRGGGGKISELSCHRNYSSLNSSIQRVGILKRRSAISALLFLLRLLEPVQLSRINSVLETSSAQLFINVNPYEYYFTRQHVQLLREKKMHCTSNIIFFYKSILPDAFDLEIFLRAPSFRVVRLPFTFYKLLISSFF